jgi:amino acid adenylation domain-containing protein
MASTDAGRATVVDERPNSLVGAWGGEAPEPPCFLELWHQVTRRHPDRVALVEGDSEFTYEELADWVAQLRESLIDRGVGAGRRVAVAGARDAAIVAAMLAVTSLGAGYVPLDATYPGVRLRHMLEDSEAMLVLEGDEVEPDLLASSRAATISLARRPARQWSGERWEPGEHREPDDAVYVIYTSGSTGRPNGVELPHRVIDNMVSWQIQHSVAPDLRTAQFAPLNFDVWFQEVLGTLCGGGSLVLVPEGCRSDPFSFLDLLAEQRVERLFLPYMAMQMLALASTNFEGLEELSLREVNLAGEQLLCSPTIRSFFEALLGCRLNNHYGQSESAMVSAHTLSGPPGSWPSLPPIGTPLPGCEILVDPLGGDDARSGELLVCGAAVANGYLHRPDLNARRYVTIPATPRGHTRAFRTGDLVRLSEDGALEFLGRIDDEVKIRGFRVNPKEVESCLLSLGGVVEATCVTLTMPDRTRQLHAAVVIGDGTPEVEGLRAELRATLPPHAVPLSITLMEEMPKTPSGKIDRKGLAGLIAERRNVRVAEAESY